MIIRRRIFEKYENYTFSIPIEEKDRVFVSPDQKVKKGEELYKTVKNNIKHSFYLPDEINCNINHSHEYVTCIDGEFIDSGDTIAEKISSNGLFTNKLISPSSGVVELARIKSGFLDILGEEGEHIVESQFEGYVKEVNPVDGITVTADAYALDILAMSNVPNREEGKTVGGEFVFLGNGKEIKFKGDDDNYLNKVVFVGKHLHPSLLQDLFEKGASFVLTCSMEYEDFRNQSLPIGVISGFGDVFSSDKLLKKLRSFEGSYVVLDWEESQAFFISDEDLTEDKTRGSFVRNLIGNTVISKSNSNYGMNGKIVDIQDGGEYVTVEWNEGRNRTIIHISLLEIVSL